MAINTLITIKDALTQFVADHEQLKRIEFEADDHRAPKITEGDEFPMLFVAPIDVNVTRAMNVHTLRIYVYERINDAREDVWENANDTSLILRDIRVWWNDYSDTDIQIINDVSGEFASDRELDNLVGYFANFEFEIPSHGRCQVPINPTPPFVPTCSDGTVNINKSDSTLIASVTVASGGIEAYNVDDSTAELRDTAGGLISTTQIKATELEVITAPNVGLNINETNEGSFLSGSTIDLELTDGTTLVTPASVVVAGQNVTVTLPEPTPTEGWQRPSDWLPIPSIAEGEQVVYFLYWATDNDSNYVAFKFLGSYTVDWGDTLSENVNSNVNAKHLFDYTTLGNQIVVDGITYRQALIKVTPQAGENLTVINTTENYGSPVASQRTYRIKEITISMPNATTYTTGGSTTKLSFCEHLNFIDAGVNPNFTSLGVYLTNLKKISFKNTPKPTSLSSFLNLSYGNVEVDDIDFVNVTSMATMCGTSTGFGKIIGSAPSLTTMLNAFNNGFGVHKVELTGTSLLTNISSVANGARNLVSFKILDASAVTTTTTAFTMSSNPPGCSLEEVILGGITVGFSVNSLLMSAKTLDAMFTALGTASGSQTIDVRNNPGSTTCNPTIATAKGFTVTTV